MIIDIQKISNHYYIHLGLEDEKWETYIKHSLKDAISLMTYKIEQVVGLLNTQEEVAAGLEFKPERDFSREMEMSELEKEKANLVMKKLRLDHLDKNLKTGVEDHFEVITKEKLNDKEETDTEESPKD